jgi:ComF family protein
LLEIARAAARFVLPSDCLACRTRPVERFFEGGVCRACWESLPERDAATCVRCDETVSDFVPSVCGRCLLDPPEFDGLRAAAPYVGSARDILLAFKFRGADYLASRLAAVMAGRLETESALEMACVPATGRARRLRGYHPAEALAAALSVRLAIPFARRRLFKRRETEVQSRLPLSQRPSNVRGAFRVAGRPAERILLVDDVATSGATSRECARQLKRAGAREVIVWCFARASRADLPSGVPGIAETGASR